MNKLIPVLLASLFVAPSFASEELARAKNCMTCHAPAKKIVGPSYKEMAERRAGEKDAVATMAAKIKSGSKDEWGKVPMPANAVSDEEAKTLARWVLTFK